MANPWDMDWGSGQTPPVSPWDRDWSSGPLDVPSDAMTPPDTMTAPGALPQVGLPAPITGVDPRQAPVMSGQGRVQATAGDDLKAGKLLFEQGVEGIKSVPALMDVLAPYMLDVTAQEIDKVGQLAPEDNLTELADIQTQISDLYQRGVAGEPVDREYAALKARERELTNVVYGQQRADGYYDAARDPERLSDVAAALVKLGPRVGRLGALQQEVANIPIDPDAAATLGADGFLEAVGLFLQHPAVSTRTALLRSLPAMLPAVGASVGGYALGGPVGGAIAGAGVGGATELAVSIGTKLGEELMAAGINPSDQGAVDAWLQDNPDVLAEITRDSFARAGAITGVEALTGGVTGSLIQGIRATNRAAQTARIAGSVTSELGGEMLGEAAALTAEGEPLKGGEILAEGLGALGPTAIQIPGMVVAEQARTPTGQLKRLAAEIEAAPTPPVTLAEVLAPFVTPQNIEPAPETRQAPALPQENTILPPPVAVAPTVAEIPDDQERQEVRQEVPPEAVDEALAAADEAYSRDSRFARPLLARIKAAGGIDPDSTAGQELIARGYTNRDYPGLLRRGGIKDFDTFIASEWEDDLPGITSAAGLAEDGTYLDPQGFIDLMAMEAGRQEWLPSRIEAANLRQQAVDADGAVMSGGYDIPVLEDDPSVATPAEWFIPAPDSEFGTGVQRIEAIERGLNMVTSDLNVSLTGEERQMVVEQLSANGGSIENAIIDTITQQYLANSEGGERTAPVDLVGDIPFADADGPVAGAPESAGARSGGDTVATKEQGPAQKVTYDDFRNAIPKDANGDHDFMGAGADAIEAVTGERMPWGQLSDDQKREVVSRLRGAPVTEATPEGEQYVIPGAEQSQAQAQKMQDDEAKVEMAARQQQSKIRRDNQTRVEDEAGGLFGPRQDDLFGAGDSQEASKKASDGKQTEKPVTNVVDAEADQETDAPQIEDEAGQEEGKLMDVGAKIGRRPPGRLSPSFLRFSFNNRPSVLRTALRDAGFDPNRANLEDVEWQLKVVSKMVTEKFGVRIVMPTTQVRKKNRFGRKIIEDRRSITSREALDQLLDAYQNMQLLAHIMGVPEKAIGLPIDGKGITLSLVSIKKLRGALGMFSWGSNGRSITLPGRSNSFAHEWGHALDHYLNNVVNRPTWVAKLGMLTRAQSQKGLTQRYPENTPKAEITSAFARVIWSMFGDGAKVAALKLQLQLDSAQVDAEGNPTPKALRAIDAIKDMEEGKAPPQSYLSDYFKASEQFDLNVEGGGYFIDPAEMFARAFEAWVGRAGAVLTEQTQSFLSKGQWAYDDTNDQRLAMTFPKGADAAQFSIAMVELTHALQRSELFGPDAPAAMPDRIDVVSPTALLKFQKPASVAAREWDALTTGLTKLRNTLRISTAKNAIMTGMKGYMTFHRYVINTTAHAVYKTAMKQENPKAKQAILNILRQIGKINPGTGQFQGSIYQEEVHAIANRRVMKIHNAVKKHLGGRKLTNEQNMILRDLLIDGPRKGTPELEALASDLRGILNEIWYDLKNAGIEVGYAENYLPHIHDVRKVDDNPDGFKRKARQVYDLVFEREVVQNADEEGQLADMKTIINKLRRAPVPLPDGDMIKTSRLFEEDEAAIKAWNEARSDVNRAAKDMENAKTPRGEAAAAARLQEAEARYRELHAEVLRFLKNRYSDYAVEKWYTEMGLGPLHDMGSIGPTVNFLKNRVLPTETGTILADYMMTNTIDLISGYSFAAARRAEYAKRFGADNVKLENMLRAARLAGATKEDEALVAHAVKVATGRMVQSNSGMGKVWSTAMVFGNMAMLGLASFTSLAEAAVTGMRTGRARDGLWAFVEALRALGRNRRHELKELASAVGLIAPYSMETVMENRMGVDAMDLSPFMERALGNFFIANGLTPLTQFQRVTNIPMANAFITRLLRDSVQGKRTINSRLRDANAGGRGKFADAELNELGIQADDRADLLEWLDSVGGLPTIEDLYSTDGGMHRAGEIWSRAVNRFVNETIQNPLKTDRSMAANDPHYAAMFGIMSFIDGFTRNVILRNLNRGVQMDDSIMVAGRKMTVNAFLTAAPFAVVLAGHLLTTILREFLLNQDKWDELEEEGDDELEKWLFKRAFYRTGITGRFDPLVQMYVGTKYERDLTAITAGPYLAFFLQNMMKIIQTSTGRNSANTNTTEWNAARAAYQLAAQPALALMWGSIPTGPVSAQFVRAGLIYTSAYSTSMAWADFWVGEKGTRYDDAGIIDPWLEFGD